jgi:hypothetical protein
MTGKTLLDSIVDKMAAAIQEFEGWNPGSRSYRNNNPGNLRWFDSIASIPWAGATGLDDQNHVIFDSYDSGLAALKHQLSLAFMGESHVYSLSDTLYDFFGKYAEGNQAQYAEFVASQLNVDPNSTLGSLIASA